MLMPISEYPSSGELPRWMIMNLLQRYKYVWDDALFTDFWNNQRSFTCLDRDPQKRLPPIDKIPCCYMDPDSRFLLVYLCLPLNWEYSRSIFQYFLKLANGGNICFVRKQDELLIRSGEINTRDNGTMLPRIEMWLSIHRKLWDILK